MKSNNLILVWLEWPEKCFRMDAGALRHLKELVPVGSRVVRVRSEGGFLRALPKATHALVWNFKSEWFVRAPRLKVLATPAAGRELIPEKGPEGVTIHFGSFHGPYMAETVLGFVLAWARGFFCPELKTLSWPRTELSSKCYRLEGTHAVIAGFGHVGREIGRKLEENGVSVVGFTRHGLYKGTACSSPGETSYSAFLCALSRADWLILALPSTTGTDRFLNAKLLAKLPKRCVVVNVGRGNAIDERALFTALKSGRLAGAYLDVRCHEPSATVLEAPGFVPELAKLSNCIVMPHTSSFGETYLSDFINELAQEGLLR